MEKLFRLKAVNSVVSYNLNTYTVAHEKLSFVVYFYMLNL